MPFEIKNKSYRDSIIEFRGVGTYTIPLASLSDNVDETISFANIKRLLWSTNNSIVITRNSNVVCQLYNSGHVNFDESGYSIANNNIGNIVVTITGGGSLIMQMSKAVGEPPPIIPDVTEFENPPLTIGSAVTTVAESPFTGGGNSYSFISSVNSYIDTPASSDWALGTDDFTIEWFGYQTTTSGFQRTFTVDDFNSIDVGVSIENATFYYWNNSGVRYSSSSATTTNTWYHLAVVRQSGVTKVYRNGILLGSQITDNNNINNTIDELTIGNENTASTLAAYVGYITNFRWVKGLAVYTGNFTVPTSALTATSDANPYGGSNTQAIGENYTKLLLIP
jgi:hypothetical protein